MIVIIDVYHGQHPTDQIIMSFWYNYMY